LILEEVEELVVEEFGVELTYAKGRVCAFATEGERDMGGE